MSSLERATGQGNRVIDRLTRTRVHLHIHRLVMVPNDLGIRKVRCRGRTDVDADAARAGSERGNAGDPSLSGRVHVEVGAG
jgi:hypothetical protein